MAPNVGRVPPPHSPIARVAAAVVGAVFLLVGILGFIPGVTTDVSGLTSHSHDSEALLLGLFQVSVLHNVVHLAFGALGLLAGRTARMARVYLIGGGLLYLALCLYGVVVPKDSPANFLPINAADDLLHLVLGAVMVGLGVMLGRGATGPPGASDDTAAGAGRT